MQTTASNLAKPKRGETTRIRQCFWDLLEHFPTSNVKIGGTVCKLCQIYHYFDVLRRKVAKTQNISLKKKGLFFGMS